ncbi:MAG: acetyl-CoA carboxylase, carboxyltransferase subunit beta [Planctomycetota bacterium]
MAWTRFGKKKDMPGGLWIKCEGCGAMIFRKEFSRFRLCPSCGHHFALTGSERVELTVDDGSFEPLWEDMRTIDRLRFQDRVPYGEKLEKVIEKTGRNEAMITGLARIHGVRCAVGVMDFSFLGGSMGVVVGEKVTRLVERAGEEGVPLVIFSASGGARMHEGALSLMQMAKTCGALHRFMAAGGFYVSVLTNPTTGGVTASFASVADVILAEPGALIGFAGPRVIATTLKQELPKGFQRAEFLLEKGQLDRIVSRQDMRRELYKLMAYATGGDPIAVPADEGAA